MAFDWQTPEAKRKAHANSQKSRKSNAERAQLAEDIDWDAAIASLQAFFAKRNHKKAPKRGCK